MSRLTVGDLVPSGLTPSDLDMLAEAVATQLRLLCSYINKSQADYERIARFESLQRRLDDIMLEK